MPEHEQYNEILQAVAEGLAAEIGGRIVADKSSDSPPGEFSSVCDIHKDGVVHDIPLARLSLNSEEGTLSLYLWCLNGWGQEHKKDLTRPDSLEQAMQLVQIANTLSSGFGHKPEKDYDKPPNPDAYRSIFTPRNR